ncbi:MAG: CvpA family protein [Planctomycetes bacterium]|nr:CvpA family protein [Planctomycetota bacterium]
MIDILLLAVLAIVTWTVAGEGPWGAALALFCVVFAGLFAMNYFEPVAVWLESLSRGSPGWARRTDFIALMGLFALAVFVLRLATDRLAPTYMQVDTFVYEVGRWTLGLATGYVTMAFLLTALHTAPFPRTVTAAGVQEFIPGFKPERKNFFGATAPDRQWLGFVQYVSYGPMPRGRVFDGPYFAAGEFEGYWPSFPIRYATRRESAAPVVLAPGATPGPGGGGLQPQQAPSDATRF